MPAAPRRGQVRCGRLEVGVLGGGGGVGVVLLIDKITNSSGTMLIEGDSGSRH